MRYRPRKDNMLSRKYYSVLGLVVVTKTKVFGLSLGSSPNHTEPAETYGDAGRSTSKCKCTRDEQKRVQVVRSTRYLVLLGDIDFSIDTGFWPGIDTSFSTLRQYWVGFNEIKPYFYWGQRRQEEFSCFINPSPFYWWEVAPSQHVYDHI